MTTGSRPTAKHARAAAAAIAWSLDADGFLSDFMRPLLGRSWHSRLRRAAESFRREAGISVGEIRAAHDAGEGLP